MSKQTPVSKPIYSLLPTDVEGFDSLAELALDMRWSWNHAADEVWRELDPAQWDLTHNPWGVLETVSRDRMERVSADPAFRKKVDALVQAKRQAAKAPAWFQQTYSKSRQAITGPRWKIMWARGQAEQRLLPDWVRARVIQAKRRTKL